MRLQAESRALDKFEMSHEFANIARERVRRVAVLVEASNNRCQAILELGGSYLLRGGNCDRINLGTKAAPGKIHSQRPGATAVFGGVADHQRAFGRDAKILQDNQAVINRGFVDQILPQGHVTFHAVNKR